MARRDLRCGSGVTCWRDGDDALLVFTEEGGVGVGGWSGSLPDMVLIGREREGVKLKWEAGGMAEGLEGLAKDAAPC